VYLKMVLAKLRYALMLRYAPGMKKDVENAVSKEDFEYLETLIKAKPEHISSATLSILLDAYQALRSSVIDSLPLEMALIKILGEQK
ncbi:MAG: hypothetical protein WCK91_03035, partial [bacterium]